MSEATNRLKAATPAEPARPDGAEHYQRLMAKIWKQDRPLSCNFELTYRCNLKCEFCYNVDQPETAELTTPQILDTLRKLADLGVMYCALTGGEPMVHPDFWQIARAVKRHHMGLRIYTNGCFIDDEAADRFASDVRAIEMEISIHGSTGEIHDRLTGMRDSLERALAGVRRLRARGVKVMLKMPITRQNQHQVWDVYRLGVDLDAPVTFDPVITPRDDGDVDPLRLQATPEFLAKFWSSEWKELRAGYEVAPMDHTTIRANCGTGQTTIALDPYGNIFPCVQWRRSAGNVLEVEDLADLWRTSQVLAEVRKVALEVPRETLGGCESGQFCTFCPGVAELQTGDPKQMYPQALANARAKERSFRAVRAPGAGDRTEENPVEVCELSG